MTNIIDLQKKCCNAFGLEKVNVNINLCKKL